MDNRHVIAGAPEVRTAVRVRGMSHGELYFDEEASTTRVTKEFIVMQLRNRVDLDAEVHVTNVRNRIGGIYRVSWTNVQPEDTLYRVGLELLDPEGEIWDADCVSESQDTGEVHTVCLECQRCKTSVATSVLEAEPDAVREGFIISRHCDTCKATTGWGYVAEMPAAPPASVTPAASATASSSPVAAAPLDPALRNGGIEQRQKGRAPIRMTIKLMRKKYGRDIADVCETINISRTGIYFRTDQAYEPGENVQVVLPFHPDSLSIPMPGRVVRQDQNAGTYVKFVAVHLTPAKT